MLLATMSNSSLSEEASVSSGTRVQDFSCLNPILTAISPHHPQHHQQQKIKKKRNQPGNPDPDAEVIALSPTTLMATNRFVCEICNKGFQRDQNLQLHRRGHNLPWKLRQRNAKEMMRKRVYVCPEPSCVHHNPSRALGDLTGIKKHFCRKHGEKKWRCDKCSKRYAVQSDWKAHSKTCGTREYRCDCGTLFSRKDSFVTHRAFCDALAEESARLSNPFTPTTPTPHAPTQTITPTTTNHHHLILQQHQQQNPSSSPLFPLQTHFSSPLSITWDPLQNPNPNPVPIQIKPETQLPITIISPSYQDPPPLKQQQQHHHHHHHHVMQSSSPFNPHQLVTSFPPTRLEMDDGVFVGQMGAGISPEYLGYMSENMGTWQKSDRLTRDFLGLTGEISSLTGMDFAFDRDDHAVRKNNTTTAAAAAASFAFHSWADC